MAVKVFCCLVWLVAAFCAEAAVALNRVAANMQKDANRSTDLIFVLLDCTIEPFHEATMGSMFVRVLFPVARARFPGCVLGNRHHETAVLHAL